MALHAQRGGEGRGASDTITFGVMGLHLSGEITARTMCDLSFLEVSQLFQLQTHADYELRPGIHGEKRTSLYELAEGIRRVLNDTGAALRNLGCEDFYDLFVKFTPRVAEVDEDGRPAPPSAEALLAKILPHLVWLQDAYVLPPPAAAASTAAAPAAAAAESVSAPSASASSASSTPASSSVSSSSDRREVYVLKKAQLMLSDLYLRFRNDPSQSHLFAFGDASRLTVFSDNVLPAVLRARGLLRYSDELAQIVDGGQQLTDREMEASVRAAAVVACERIVQRFNEKFPDGIEEKEEQEESKSAPAAEAPAAAGSSTAGAAKRVPLTPLMLDYYLWLYGKRPEIRKLARHATRSLFY